MRWTEEKDVILVEILQSESDKLVEELITLRDESEKKGEDQSEAKREAVVNEKKQALEMRDRALERIGETKKRNEEERAKEKKTVGRKRRRSGGDMLEWLRERAESDLEIKKQEIKEKREEREAMEATRLEQQHYQQQQQQQQQQQFALMQQQMMGMFQQQQQQMQALLSFLPKKRNNLNAYTKFIIIHSSVLEIHMHTKKLYFST